MWRPAHPALEELRRFAASELDLTTAGRVAIHIDRCPECAGRVAQLEPLGHIFAAEEASSHSAPLPPMLLDDVRTAVNTDRPPTVELPVAAAFIAAAALLLVVDTPSVDRMIQDLTVATGRLGTLLTALQTVAAIIAPTEICALLLGTGLFIIGVLTASRKDLQRQM